MGLLSRTWILSPTAEVHLVCAVRLPLEPRAGLAREAIINRQRTVPFYDT